MRYFLNGQAITDDSKGRITRKVSMNDRSFLTNFTADQLLAIEALAPGVLLWVRLGAARFLMIEAIAKANAEKYREACSAESAAIDAILTACEPEYC